MSCSKYLVWLESAISKRFTLLDCWVIILQRQTAIHDLALNHRLIVLLLQLLKLMLLEFSTGICAHLILNGISTWNLRDVSSPIDLFLEILELHLLDILSDLFG